MEVCVKGYLVNEDTGEAVRLVSKGPRKQGKQVVRTRWDMPFTTAFLTPGDEITSDFSGEEARVFLHLFWTVGWNNEWSLLNQQTIANRVKMHQSQVSRVLASLTQRQVIVKGKKIGSSHAYRLNPELSWRGHMADYDAVRKATPSMIRVAA